MSHAFDLYLIAFKICIDLYPLFLFLLYSGYTHWIQSISFFWFNLTVIIEFMMALPTSTEIKCIHNLENFITVTVAIWIHRLLNYAASLSELKSSAACSNPCYLQSKASCFFLNLISWLSSFSFLFWIKYVSSSLE